MKTKLKKLLLISSSLFLFCLFSCGYYVPEKDYSQRINKVNYKNFEEINEPFVFRFDADLDFNSKSNQITYSRGSYYCIYDWETESVFDYVYVPTDDGSQSFLYQCKNKDNNLEYFSIDYFYEEKPRIFNLAENGSSVKETFMSLDFPEIKDKNLYFAQPKISNNKDYLILYDEHGYKSTNFYFFDVNSRAVTKVKEIKSESSLDEIFVDENGVCWFLDFTEDSKTKKEFVQIGFYDFATDTEDRDFLVFECEDDSAVYDEYEGWICFDRYSLRYVDSDYLVCIKRTYDESEHLNNVVKKSLIVINRENKSQKEIVIENPDDSGVREILKINNCYYVIINDGMEKTNVCRLDLKNATKEKIFEKEYAFYNRTEVRDNRIYFIYKSDYQASEANISYYDILENKYHECEKFVLEEYFENQGL